MPALFYAVLADPDWFISSMEFFPIETLPLVVASANAATTAGRAELGQ